MTSERHVRIATEGALLGSLIAHGVSPELGVLSDGAGQFDVLVHALCWLHVERPLERLVPHNEKHRQAIERIRQRIWELYTGLKAYRQAPVADGVRTRWASGSTSWSPTEPTTPRSTGC